MVRTPVYWDGMDPSIRSERIRDTVIVTLNRPARANAYDGPLLQALDEALDACENDRSVRVVIFTGAGRHFCAGADLDELRERGLRDALCLHSARLFDRIAGLRVPTIAAVNGAALGGGLELALACDVRVAAAGAVFGLPETRMGLLPAAGAIPRLPRVVGEARARVLVFTGQPIDAGTAARYGLVHDVADGAVLDAALALARDIEGADAMAVMLAKRALDNPVSGYAQAAQALLYQRRATPHD